MQQSRTPLRQDGCDLVGVFFSDKIIKAGLRFKEQGLERTGHPIMRMQVVFRT